MSSLITRAGVVLAGALLLLSAGCSNERTSASGALIDPNTGKHTAQWALPAMHGAAAKGIASSTSGFEVCQHCHSTYFSGGMSKVTCLNTVGCHGAGVMAPHPAKPWRGGIMMHTDTDPSNAPVCAQCHMNGANSSVHPSMFDPAMAPGCFNNTMCHAAAVAGPHPAGWALPTAHGPAAKAAPSSTGGFSLCQTCHGNDFTGGIALQTCLNTAGCHGATVNAPHAAAWLPGNTYTHTSTNLLNAPVCALCHTNGANSPVQPSPFDPAAAPGCFNNTLCHSTFSCGICHGIPPNGAISPNVAGQHAPHIAANSSVIGCATCHNGAGFGTPLHLNGVADVILNPTFNANSGTAAYNAAAVTCSNIACHGSSRTQTNAQGTATPPQSTPGPTPNWLTGTIDVNTQCSSCHVLGPSAGNPEVTSYFSGQHRRHVYGGASGAFSQPSCAVCHNTTLLAPDHFTQLTGPISEATVLNSINSAINFNGTTCTPSAGGLTGCHGTETW